MHTPTPPPWLWVALSATATLGAPTLWPVDAAAQKLPDIVAGPDLANSASPVEAPIDEVVVFSDRARITRRGMLAPGKGMRTLRLPDLPGGTQLNTIRLEARGARVLRLEAAPIEQDQVAIAEVETLLKDIEGLDDQLVGLRMAEQVLLAEVALLDRLTPIPPTKEGQPAQVPSKGAMKRVLDFLDGRRASLDEGQASITVRRRTLSKTRQEKVTALSQYDARAFTEQRVQVTAIVDITGSAPKVALEYFVPGATWRPDYEVEFDPARGRLTLRTAGRVRQSTGEDWRGVKMGLSTAMPGAGIDAPELLTWTLGESRQFIPQPRAMPQRRISVPLPPPARPLRPVGQQAQEQISDLQRRIQQTLSGQALTSRLSSLGQNLGDISTIVSAGESTGYGYGRGGLGVRGSGAGGGGRATKATPSRPKKRPARARRPAPPPPPPSPMAAPEPSAAYADDVAMAESASVDAVSLSGRAASAGPRVRATPLDLFDNARSTRRRLSDPSLPAVAAGGLDFTWDATTRVVVPSGPDEQQVPLAAFQAPITLYYEASPGVSTTAYLKGEVANGTGDPLLAGPVRLFSGGDFVGRGDINTVGEGGQFQLPLGADQDIQIVRTVTPSSRTEGVFSKSDVTVYTTKIQVANYKRRAIDIQITDQIPKSLREDIKIKKTKASPEAAAGPDTDGIMRFDLRLKAGATKTIEFTYTIERPADWRLWQQ
ncbi:MAG: DUF4139 domain-containing protein [Bradymonadia bacterium]